MAEGPAGGAAWWLHATDGLRLRVAHWPAQDTSHAKGTVLLFSGRTEYAEKYGRVAAEFSRRGYAMLAIDWRGQGLADRETPDRALGHVAHFADYQRDVAALLAAAAQLDLAQPLYLVAHSMGGCIALRALLEGLPVAAALFTGPMWGIQMSPLLRPLAWGLGWLGERLGFGTRYAPGNGPANYVLTTGFADNVLTRDPETYSYMKRQLRKHPELALGGPSLNWVHQALIETRALARMVAPEVPTLCFLGAQEKIVDPAAIHRRMSAWPGGRLAVIAGGEHEVMMERAPIRARVFDAAVELFAAHRP